MTNTWPIKYRITPIICDNVVIYSQAEPTKKESKLEKSAQTPKVIVSLAEIYLIHNINPFRKGLGPGPKKEF